MNFDFEKDILDWSNETISRLGYELSERNEVSSRLSQVFGILRNRIPSIPRKIKIAKHFSCSQNYLGGYRQVISEIKSGRDLMPRCSRQQTNKSGFTDRMLLDWGIYHLHLGTDKIKKGKNKGLIQGHKDILFIFITNEVAYIIGIFDHSSWAKQEVLQIVYDNWPHLLEQWKLREVVDLAQEVTDEDRKFLRDGNINSPIKIGNHIYLGPGGGITSAGNGLNEMDKALIVLKAADLLHKWITENMGVIEKNINSKLGVIKFDVSRFILSRTYSVYAPKNKLRIFIPSTDPAGSLVHPTQAMIIEPERENYSYYEPGSFSDILFQHIEGT
ncbi:hypothetical protein [Aliivibrio fischeri]|uniref:Uncharacterized protein n=1 Tax=Aliivibrio fischeri TaxID=668 RepID=A0A844P3X9_ALIFS|nr:hypothetical protein [Aliivibrio fischeri]MUK50773.1 hypothetical protein [Aliivibrio fischeri]